MKETHSRPAGSHSARSSRLQLLNLRHETRLIAIFRSRRVVLGSLEKLPLGLLNRLAAADVGGQVLVTGHHIEEVNRHQSRAVQLLTGNCKGDDLVRRIDLLLDGTRQAARTLARNFHYVRPVLSDNLAEEKRWLLVEENK